MTKNDNDRSQPVVVTASDSLLHPLDHVYSLTRGLKYVSPVLFPMAGDESLAPLSSLIKCGFGLEKLHRYRYQYRYLEATVHTPDLIVRGFELQRNARSLDVFSELLNRECRGFEDINILLAYIIQLIEHQLKYKETELPDHEHFHIFYHSKEIVSYVHWLSGQWNIDIGEFSGSDWSADTRVFAPMAESGLIMELLGGS
ncbi:hypothetical protein JXA59_00645 [Patescibacteria group bacterium]|nr:hypothetical protein [Patescibacteria group bacterium]